MSLCACVFAGGGRGLYRTQKYPCVSDANTPERLTFLTELSRAVMCGKLTPGDGSTNGGVEKVIIFKQQFPEGELKMKSNEIISTTSNHL